MFTISYHFGRRSQIFTRSILVDNFFSGTSSQKLRIGAREESPSDSLGHSLGKEGRCQDGVIGLAEASSLREVKKTGRGRQKHRTPPARAQLSYFARKKEFPKNIWKFILPGKIFLGRKRELPGADLVLLNKGQGSAVSMF